MKKLVYLFAAGTMALAACSNEPAYKIQGTVEGIADGETVYLQEAKGRELIKLDSAVVTNGAFTFNGRQDEAVNRYITYTPAEGKRIMTDFFLENGNIAISLGEESTIAGTPNNDIYQSFKVKDNAMNKEMMALYEKGKAEDLTEEQKAELEKQMETLDNQSMEFIYNFIDANITNPVGIHLWPGNSYSMELSQLQALAAKVPAEYQSNERIANLLKRIEVLAKTAVGQKFTDFTLPSPEGNPVKLSDIIAKNKYTLVDFWASWCGPCRREMPNVIAAYNEYNKKGFGIVGVSLDNDAAAWKKAIEEMNMTWDHMSDVKGWQCEGAALYGVNSIPATVLIAQDGTIIARNLRGAAIKEKLAELLK
ncbi:MAG: AhpC/TSA family protein [Bacteroides sp.]|nr:AhpC/TSA family protein [Bacteroides sp.]